MNFTVHIKELHVHVDGTNLVELITNAKEEILMALSTAEQNLIDQFNTATNAIAAKIQSLIDNPPTDDTEFNTQLQAIADGLTALGAGGQPPPPPGP